MKLHKKTMTVSGVEFDVFADIKIRGMIAINKVTQEERVIMRGGYLTKDISIKKEIALSFGL